MRARKKGLAFDVNVRSTPTSCRSRDSTFIPIKNTHGTPLPLQKPVKCLKMTLKAELSGALLENGKQSIGCALSFGSPKEYLPYAADDGLLAQTHTCVAALAAPIALGRRSLPAFLFSWPASPTRKLNASQQRRRH